MELSTLFWNASLTELKQGFTSDEHLHTCLLCGEKIEKGIVYQHDGEFYEAKRFMQMHIEMSHQSVFDYLINLNKRFTGLTEHQKKLLQLFYQGKSDQQIQNELAVGSSATIRNHRFSLKEKERQAKLFLTIMELLKEHDTHAPAFIPFHKTAKLVDDRYNVTAEEYQEIVGKYFPNGTSAPLSKFPLRQKQKLVILGELAKQLKPEGYYTERELNKLLQFYHDDYAMVRRYLIEYGFLDRKADGSQYWLKK